MSAKKHLRPYLLATLVGFVVGLVALIVIYEDDLERGVDRDEKISIAVIDTCVRENVSFYKPGHLLEVRILFQARHFLDFLLYYESAANILLATTLLVPFAVYTSDVVAASRRKREHGVV
jgi:hypothetical protein